MLLEGLNLSPSVSAVDSMIDSNISLSAMATASFTHVAKYSWVIAGAGGVWLQLCGYKQVSARSMPICFYTPFSNQTLDIFMQ